MRTMSEEKDPRRTSILMVRLSAEERQVLDAAASADAMPTGTWLRSVAVREARARARKREKGT